MGDNAPSVGELKQRIAQGDKSVLRTCISYAANIAGTGPYWYKCKQQLQAFVKFMVWKGSGLPSFFLTGSCAEFHWTPLIKLLQELLRANGDHTDIVNDLVARRRVVKQYSNVVCKYFHLKTQSYIEDVLGPVYGVVDHYIRFEYAASRGQIHFHMLAYRMDRKPHGILQEGVESGSTKDRAAWEADVGKWFEQLGFTAEHPGKDDKGLWAPPEGTLYPEERCLEKDFRALGADQMHECHVVNKCMIHCCNKYCLKGKGALCQCRSGFGHKEDMKEVEGARGKWFQGSKRMRVVFGIIQDVKGYLVGEMPRNHPRMMQHIRGMPGLWGGNCDQTPIITASDPSNPDPREMERSVCYTTGYMCKNKDTIGGTLDVMTAVVRAQDEEGDDLPINKTILQCMNKTVGRQEVSDPAAASFLACLPLWQCSRSFQPVSLGSYRGITPWNVRKSKRGQSGGDSVPVDGATDGMSAVAKNIVDKYKDAVVAGQDFQLVALGVVVPVSSMSLYAWASGPFKRQAIGSVCPVPSGANTEATWPVTAQYARAMMILHSPGFILGDDWGDDQWTTSFETFLSSKECPPMVKGEVDAAQRRWQKRKGGSPESDDSEGASDSSEEQEGYDSDQDWRDVMAGHKADGAGEAPDRDESQIYRGIGDGTEWGTNAVYPHIHPMGCWAEFKDLLKPYH